MSDETELTESVQEQEIEPIVQEEVKPDEPKESETRRLRIFCPVCGMLSPDKRFLAEHPFPNVMEYHYKGRGKIACDYVLDDTEDVITLVDSVKEQLITVIKNSFTIEQMRSLNRALVNTINKHDEKLD